MAIACNCWEERPSASGTTPVATPESGSSVKVSTSSVRRLLRLAVMSVSTTRATIGLLDEQREAAMGRRDETVT
jgi:hypothetical protein